MAEDLVREILRDPHPVGRGHRGLVAVQHRLEGVSDAQFQLSLAEMRVVEPGPERLKQRVVDAAPDPGERVGLAGGVARYTVLRTGGPRRRLPLR